MLKRVSLYPPFLLDSPPPTDDFAVSLPEPKSDPGTEPDPHCGGRLLVTAAGEKWAEKLNVLATCVVGEETTGGVYVGPCYPPPPKSAYVREEGVRERSERK